MSVARTGVCILKAKKNIGRVRGHDDGESEVDNDR